MTDERGDFDNVRKVEIAMYAVQTERQERIAPCPASPIFIGGQRRSGTTLLFTMLNRHPHLAGVREEGFFFQDERFELFFRSLLVWHGRRLKRLGIGQPEMDGAVATFIDSLLTPHRMHEGTHRWIEKTTKNIERIDYLLRLFPDAQFIHVIRDPRDTLCSMKQRVEADRPDWVKYTAYDTALEWVRIIEAGLPWRDRPERYMEVHYEQLTHEPEAVLRRVLAFLGEPWCFAVLDATPDAAPFQEGGNDQKPVFTSSNGRWKTELSREEVACIQSIAGETMALLGYDVEAI
jgi:hypothetical protein